MYWMLSSNENRQRMRCKLVENLKFDSHFEASRLRDFSGYNEHSAMSASTLKVTGATAATSTVDEADSASNMNHEETNDLAQKLQMNKEAINSQINEDFIGDDECHSLQHTQQTTGTSQQSASGSTGLSVQQTDSGVVTSNSDLSRRASITSSTTMNSLTSSTTTVTTTTVNSNATSSTVPTIKINKYVDLILLSV
jgi:hypothetical protein